MTFGTHRALLGHPPPPQNKYSIRSRAIEDATGALLEGRLLDFVKINSRELEVSFTRDRSPFVTYTYAIAVGLRFFDVLKESLHQNRAKLDLLTGTCMGNDGSRILHFRAWSERPSQPSASACATSAASGPSNSYFKRGIQ